MKHKNCPNCQEPPDSDNWAKNGKLQQHCTECDWTGTPRTPEQQPPQTTRTYHDPLGTSWHYQINDKYNHTYITSRSYPTRKKAIIELKQELKTQQNHKTRGPMTATLYPPTITITGETFTTITQKPQKPPKNKMTQQNNSEDLTFKWMVTIATILTLALLTLLTYLITN